MMTKFAQKSLDLPEVLLVDVRQLKDSRGYFMETYRENDFSAIGIRGPFLQDNHSASKRQGTIRGLHFQHRPEPQAKLVRVVQGAIFDVVVDLRGDSKNFGKWCSVVLTAQLGTTLFVPPGFAHGFCTLEDNTHVTYKVDRYYSPTLDAGIAWNDPDIGVSWPFTDEQLILSDRDAALPRLRDMPAPFTTEGG